MQTDMVSYYAKRAGEYERIYAKPERQEDLRRVRRISAEALRGHDILELSCGTGYWTEAFAPSARSVLACDINEEVLEIARSKTWDTTPVEFVQADSYELPHFERPFSAAFAGFWWSHIPKRKIPGFLNGLHAKLRRGARVMFVDNRYVEGSSTPIFRTDEAGDAYQHRRLADGSTHEVLKNFPTAEELLLAVADTSSAAEATLTEYFWVLTYLTK
jgi:SAM-dependent methyltransferase